MMKGILGVLLFIAVVSATTETGDIEDTIQAVARSVVTKNATVAKDAVCTNIAVHHCQYLQCNAALCTVKRQDGAMISTGRGEIQCCCNTAPVSCQFCIQPVK